MARVNVRYENPFVDPPEARDAARRLRGRLVAPVTLWTAGDEDARTGLTISSIVIAAGEPAEALGLMSETTDLLDAITDTRTFVIHVLGDGDKVLADRFAGVRPSPGGLFVDLDVDQTRWGPAIATVVNRAYCRLIRTERAGYQVMVAGAIERVELDELDTPLVYFRGRYRALH